MPLFTFSGLVETAYPFDRDAAGRPVGAVQPGDVRDLDGPLDGQWALAGDGQDTQGGTGSGPGPAGIPAAPEPASEPAPEPVPAADGPQPAPPAVIPAAGPQPFAVTTDQQ